VVQSLDANQHDGGAQVLRHAAISVRTRARVVRAITVRSVSSAAQGKKLTEAGQPESIVRAMGPEEGHAGDPGEQSVPGARSSLHCRANDNHDLKKFPTDAVFSN
jgi:hypothetical protein